MCTYVYVQIRVCTSALIPHPEPKTIFNHFFFDFRFLLENGSDRVRIGKGVDGVGNALTCMYYVYVCVLMCTCV